MEKVRPLLCFSNSCPLLADAELLLYRIFHDRPLRYVRAGIVVVNANDDDGDDSIEAESRRRIMVF